MPPQNCLFLLSSEIPEKIIILKNYTAPVNYIKIMIDRLAIVDLKNFNWCNVILQIKNHRLTHRKSITIHSCNKQPISHFRTKCYIQKELKYFIFICDLEAL